MMKILITGNMGYVGAVLIDHLRSTFPKAELVGYDMAYFGASLINATVLPESKLDVQLFGDVRAMSVEILKGVDVVIHLAAISNDPMGARYENITLNVNYASTLKIAQMAKGAGAKVFVFASSCSVYGADEGIPRTEQSDLNPLTTYARSKVLAEKELELLADDTFIVTCLRFATACGFSKRLRLDLVLNDFVASAVSLGAINIFSDGTPWRALIHVTDMARAIQWAINRKASNGGQFLIVNIGSDDWNYQVKELAEVVADEIPGTKIMLNRDTSPDKRSYRVSFHLFKLLAPDYQPRYTLRQTVKELYKGLLAVHFKDTDFRNSHLMRLKVLINLQNSQDLNDELEWIHMGSKLS